MDRFLYSSLSSTGRKLISSKVQSDLKQRSVEEKIKLFPITISGTQAKINYAVIPISSVENDILKDYKEFRDRSIIVMGASVTSLSSAAIFAFNKLATSHFWKSKGWKPALVCAFCLLLIFAEQVRKDTVSFKLSDILQFSENEELFKYPQMAMTREDVDTKTFSLEDQIQYFKSHEDELERRIMLLLESDSFFFTSNTEITLKALSWEEIEKDQNFSFISFKIYFENILDEINR